MESNTPENGLEFAVTGRSLMKYALPTLLSNIFMNIYATVDSLFVANLIGTNGLSALNIVMPLLMVGMAAGVMIASGGSALVAKMLGEGKSYEGKQIFTFLVIVGVAVCAALCAAGYIFRRPLLTLLGADETLYPLCEEYANVLFVVLAPTMAGMIYQTFFTAAGKPGIGFGLAVAGGVLNMILDYVLIAVCSMGMTGAALATGTGYIVQSVIGTAYFLFKRDGLLYFVTPAWNLRALVKSCSNGVSEMVSTLTGSVTMIAMNVILMRISGAEGVAAAAVVLSMQMILSAAFMGYLFGVAPVISYNYGKGDIGNLQKLYRVVRRTIILVSVVMFLLTFVLARPVALLYGDGVERVIRMSVQGIFVLAPSFLLMGYNMFASSMFTALNDGKVSAVISFCRTFVFLLIPMLILPPLIGVWGVWLALPLAEVAGAIVATYYFRTKKTVYHYA